MQGRVICTEDPFEVEWHCRAALSMRPEAIGFDSEWRADDGIHLSQTALVQVRIWQQLCITCTVNILHLCSSFINKAACQMVKVSLPQMLYSLC